MFISIDDLTINTQHITHITIVRKEADEPHIPPIRHVDIHLVNNAAVRLTHDQYCRFMMSFRVGSNLADEYHRDGQPFNDHLLLDSR